MYFVIIILFVSDVCMFDGVAQQEGRKTKFAKAIF